MNKSYLILIAFFIVLFNACDSTDKPKSYFSNSQKDSLMVDLITYVYKKPIGANSSNKFNPEYRNFYKNQLNNFEWIELEMKSENEYYFLVKRPARDVNDRIRTVGGVFKVQNTDDSIKIVDLTEIFVSPLLQYEEALVRGRYIFSEMVKKDGDINDLLHLNHYIEFPDERTAYDPEINEWVYNQ